MRGTWLDLWGPTAAAITFLTAVLLFRRWSVAQTIYEWDVGLLYVNGRFERILEPGQHRFFRPWVRIDIYVVRTAEQYLPAANADVISADKLPFRLSAMIVYKVIDPRTFFERRSEVLLQQSVITGLTQLAATQTLQEQLEHRADMGSRLVELIGPTIRECEIIGAHIIGLQLPPEIRRSFSEVERARLEGLAALERARGEHAALRSLANAARVLKGNPELANLRLLQTVSGSQRGPTTLVIGQHALSGAEPTKPGDRPSADQT